MSRNPFETTEDVSFHKVDDLDYIHNGMGIGIGIGLVSSVLSFCLRQDTSLFPSIYETILQTVGYKSFIDPYHNSLLIKCMGDILVGKTVGAFMLSHYYKADGENEKR